MKKKWFIVSNAWMAPARRTATTDAPTLRRNMSWFAFATNPARSIRAFISVDTSEKYVGDARMIPSASSIFSIQSLRTSPFTAHRLSWLVKPFPQAVQPRIFFPASWTSSVLIPAFFSSLNTALTRMAVLPSFRALPLNATTFMVHLYTGCWYPDIKNRGCPAPACDGCFSTPSYELAHQMVLRYEFPYTVF